MSHEGKIPVVLIAFKRPKETQQTLDAIAAYSPERLYVICDGPRTEADLAPRAEVLSLLDALPSTVEIKKLIADENMGVRARVSTGLDWVFDQEEAAIILEDDCVAHPDFFRFCETLLHHYRDDDRVLHIGGNNYQKGQRRTDASYYFSRHTHCWGWATWRRAWKLYDRDLSHWDTFRQMRGMADYSNTQLEEDYFMRCVQSVADGETDSWAYIWGYSCMLHNGLAIVPEKNLVSNIGFSSTAVHTKTKQWFSNLATDEIGEIIHPKTVVRNREADGFTFDHFFGGIDMRNQYHWRQRIKRIRPAIMRRLKRLTKNNEGPRTNAADESQ